MSLRGTDTSLQYLAGPQTGFMAFLTPLLPQCTHDRRRLSRLPARDRLFWSSCYVADFRLAKIRASGLGCAGPIRRNVFRSV